MSGDTLRPGSEVDPTAAMVESICEQAQLVSELQCELDEARDALTSRLAGLEGTVVALWAVATKINCRDGGDPQHASDGSPFSVKSGPQEVSGKFEFRRVVNMGTRIIMFVMRSVEDGVFWRVDPVTLKPLPQPEQDQCL